MVVLRGGKAKMIIAEGRIILINIFCRLGWARSRNDGIVSFEVDQ